ncbi:MAG: RNA methyltransferase [Erysipelotrichaceae bacterium]|nr:RNA methyltransferase [Erysipelotrichaceae bacterium]
MEVIRSLENSRIKLYNSLKMKKYRDRHQLFLVQERHLIQEAIRNDCLDTLIIREGAENPFDLECLTVSAEVMKKLSENESLNDCIGVCRISEGKLAEPRRLIVLEDVQDPGNVGTIIRTAHCFGYDGVLLSDRCADLYNAKTVSACQGAIFAIPVIRRSMDEILEYLKDRKITVYGTSLKESRYLSGIRPAEKFALVFGNEGQGLSEKTLKGCDECFKIEMDNFDSLNVAAAMAIASYEMRYEK